MRALFALLFCTFELREPERSGVDMKISSSECTSTRRRDIVLLLLITNHIVGAGGSNDDDDDCNSLGDAAHSSVFVCRQVLL